MSYSFVRNRIFRFFDVFQMIVKKFRKGNLKSQSESLQNCLYCFISILVGAYDYVFPFLVSA